MSDNLVKAFKEKLTEIYSDVAQRELYLWGMGKGADAVLEVLQSENIVVSGIIDQSAECCPTYRGYPVVKKESIVQKDIYIIVTLIRFHDSVVDYLFNNGFRTKDWCYAYDHLIYHEKDTIYKGCHIGRYTYGYEGLLEKYPLAVSIGRFCSINTTAKIWNNHPVDYVTTHPILDFPFFYPWEQYEERKELIQRYGKHWNNADYENSPLRDNRPVVIGNDVWIGANVCIMPGVTIGDGAILAAGAVVTKDVDPYAIVGGVPAKVIRYRFSKELIDKLLEIRWWNWSIAEIEENIELFYQPDKFIERFVI